MSKKALPLSSVFPGAWLWKSKGKEYNMKTNIRFLIMASLVLATAVFAQQKGSFTDARDKKTYKTVKIGEQTWLAENLNFAAKDSKCYGNKEANCKKYGRLYNGKTSKTICPAGWHLPTGEEWETLPKADNAKALKTKSGWKDDFNDDGEKISGNGEDKFGFAALPGGLYGFDSGPGEDGFFFADRCGFWNSTTDYYIICSGIAGFMGLSYWEYDEDNFLSVRCVKD